MLKSFILILCCYVSLSFAFEPIWEAVVKKVEAPLCNEVLKEPLRINLNEADASSLQQIKGIGPKKAQAIIDFRQIHGPFKTLEELKQVRGFSSRIVAKILTNNASILVLY